MTIAERQGCEDGDGGSVPLLSFDADRKHHIIAKALYIAQKAILADQYPAYSDATDMRELLELHYHHSLQVFQFTDDLRNALSLGYISNGGATAQELMDFLELRGAESASFKPIEVPDFD